MPGKVAFITGVTGQDGSYLAELLLGKGYAVHGLMRRSSSFNTERIEHLMTAADSRLTLHFGDVTDPFSVARVLGLIKADAPDVVEIYNLAAQSHVKVSFEMPSYTAQADGVGVLSVLEAVRLTGFSCPVRVCQASTSEMFGATPPPQSETTPFHPRSPYAAAKLFGYWAIRNYREAYGMFACNCIAFNHESERRGKTFVTRKITQGIARISRGSNISSPLELGNLDALRDWGHAADYVRAMWLMLQQESPDDYVVATGEQHSVREFVEIAFEAAGMPMYWCGSGLEEVGKLLETHEVVVIINPKYFRPTEVDSLLGDSTKLRDATGWKPEVSFKDLVRRMVAHDLAEPWHP